MTRDGAVWCKTGGMRLGQMPLLWVLAAVFSWLAPTAARAVEGDAPLVLQSPPDLSAFVGRPINSIQVVTEGARWIQSPKLEHARVGQLLTADLAAAEERLTMLLLASSHKAGLSPPNATEERSSS